MPRSLPPIELDPAWYDAIPVRVSRRRFDGRPLAEETLAAVRSAAHRLSAGSDVRISLVVADASGPGSSATFDTSRCDALFRGFVGSYGKIIGVPVAAVLSAPSERDVAVGYVGEAFILEATRLGLDTCWVAGFFDRARAGAELLPGERVYAITPVGHAPMRAGAAERSISSLVRARSRLTAEEIAPGWDTWPEWARIAIEAARLAPSGGNRQPWRFRLDDNELVLFERDWSGKPYLTHRIDLGIAMLHAELGAHAAGARARWELADGTEESAPGSGGDAGTTARSDGVARLRPA